MGNLKIVVGGVDNRAWDIDYFSIIDYKEQETGTLITLNGHLCNGLSKLFIPMSKIAFEKIYNDAKLNMDTIQKQVNDKLKEIGNKYQYFDKPITNYVNLHWGIPTKIS